MKRMMRRRRKRNERKRERDVIGLIDLIAKRYVPALRARREGGCRRGEEVPISFIDSFLRGTGIPTLLLAH